uniref:fibrinogen-like protein 1 n=1 Tax=Styela clava TaxID=7725 RepID=UPI00193A4797|nr:fibrinogen-like protein 1 [Styela clava]
MNIIGVTILLGLTLFHSANTLTCLPCEEHLLNPEGIEVKVKRECPKLNCPGSEAPGICPCCNRCAKQKGETCGGDFNMEGDCDKKLRCVTPQSRVNPDNSVSLTFIHNRGGKCDDSVAPLDCMDVCSKTTKANNDPIGMATRGRTDFFDYKRPSEISSHGTWFYCDCSVGESGSGWMVMQRRYLDMESFDRDLRHYIHGFGMPTGDYWMGLQAIRHFTSTVPHELRITVKLADGRQFTTYFDQFSIGDEKENFKLRITPTPEQASVDFAAMHNGMEFTARDSDNDQWRDGNCAKSYGGGWWFNRCTDFNLNGKLYGVTMFPLPEDDVVDEDGPDRVSWDACNGWKIVQTEMAIRPSLQYPPIIYN